MPSTPSPDGTARPSTDVRQNRRTRRATRSPGADPVDTQVAGMPPERRPVAPVGGGRSRRGSGPVRRRPPAEMGAVDVGQAPLVAGGRP